MTILRSMDVRSVFILQILTHPVVCYFLYSFSHPRWGFLVNLSYFILGTIVIFCIICFTFQPNALWKR